MITHRELLSEPEQIEPLAEKLLEEQFIAFDTEFIRERTFYPVLEIIQVATKQESWLIDAQKYRNQDSPPNRLQPLLDVFQHPNILKIAHAAQADQECLYSSFGITAMPILDTAIAASLCGYGEQVGLGNLLKSVLNVTIKKGHARTNWSARPLPKQLVKYAHQDVIHLVKLGETLMAELEKLGRKQWALDLSSQWEDPEQYESNPEQILHRLAKNGRINHKNYPVLAKLVQWREERIRELNLPRRWVADDNVLITLADVRPKDIDHLKTFRGLNKREINDDGGEILKIIAEGEQNTGLTMPVSNQPNPPSTSEARAIELLRCYIGILSNQHKISSSNLVDPNYYLRILRSHPQTPEDLVKKAFLTPHAAKLIGDEIIALLHGKRALSLSQGEVKVVEAKEKTSIP